MGLRDVWDLAKRIDSLMALEAAHHQSTADLKQTIAALERRVARLEHREDIVVTEAKAAARSASYEASQGTMSELARRIGVLEGGSPQPRTSKRAVRKKPD